MKFIALIAALLLEQLRPLRRDNVLYEGYAAFARLLRRNFDAGESRQAVLTWLLAVVPFVALVLAVDWLLQGISTPLALLWGIVVLYCTVGFRQFSYFYNGISDLLKAGDIAGARLQLTRWRGEEASELTAAEVARVAIELGLTASHRTVFGPVAWFVVLGPAGALLYRAADLLVQTWRRQPDSDDSESPVFALFARRAFDVIDWVPARLTAAGFAVAGDFQGAAECWRTQARSWAHQGDGILLAAGAGALGVRLGGEVHEYGRVRYRPDLGTGDDADVDYLSSTVGLIWRALVLWMFLIGLVTLAHSLG